jgi:CelD/BcsL family acetyltransferase involved in cellulose biosynthesis
VPLDIRHVQRATAQEWDAHWQGCDHATYFHSREWAEVWQAATRGRVQAEPHLVTFSDGATALLPLCSTPTMARLAKTYLSGHVATLGGWISDDDLAAPHAALLADALTRRFGNVVWKLNPFDPLTTPFRSLANEPDETDVLDLSPGFEEVHRRWTKGHRSAVTKARRVGVTVSTASTPEDWRAYHAVFQDSVRRWGKDAFFIHGPELFQELGRQRRPNVRLWLARFEGEVVAGALCLYANHHVSYWHGAALQRHFPLRPVNLLLYEAIRHACEQRHLRWFDLGSSGPLEGVRSFKRSFGPSAMPCPTVRVEADWLRLARAGRKAAGRLLARARTAAGVASTPEAGSTA